MSFFTDINDRIEKATSRLSFGADKRLNTYEQLASMTRDNIPIDACVNRIYERKLARSRGDRHIFKRWANALSSGKSFSQAIADDVPDAELVLIGAGERSRDLANGLEQAVYVARASQAMRSAVIKELAMPVVMIAALTALVIGFSLKMAPEFAKMLPPAKWSSSGQVLYAISKVVSQFWMVGLIGLFVIGGAIGYSVPRWTGTLRAKFDRIPPYSIYRTISSSTFMVALASLLRSEVPLPEALKFIRANSSPWARSHLAVMSARIRAGREYGEVLETGMLDDETSDNVVIYSKSQDFDVAIMNLGTRAIDASVKRLKAQAAVANIVVMMVIGLSIGWIVSEVFDISQRATKVSAQSQATRLK